MARVGTRKLTIMVGGTLSGTTLTGGTEFTAEVSALTIDADDAKRDFISFADAAAGGGRDYVLKMTLVQDPATATLWDKVWSNAGTDTPFQLKPYGSVAATTSNPWFVGMATIKEPNGTLIGGEADQSSTAVWTIDVEWPCVPFTGSTTGKPIRVTA